MVNSICIFPSSGHALVIDNKDYNYTLVVSGQNFQIVHHDDGKNLTYKHGVNVSQSDDGGNYRGLKCTKVHPKITNDKIFGAQTKNNMKIFKRLTSDLTDLNSMPGARHIGSWCLRLYPRNCHIFQGGSYIAWSKLIN